MAYGGGSSIISGAISIGNGRKRLADRHLMAAAKAALSNNQQKNGGKRQRRSKMDGEQNGLIARKSDVASITAI